MSDERPGDEGGYQRPRIIKAVRLGGATSRRRFIATSIVAAALPAAEGCQTSTIDIEAEGGVCTCHAVCVCDVDSGGESNESVFESEYDGDTCTCDTVCSCDTVCTCNSQGGSGGGGGSSSYWY